MIEISIIRSVLMREYFRKFAHDAAWAMGTS